MGFIVPAVVQLATLNQILNTNCTLRLFSNNKTPLHADSTGAYTEVAGAGYAGKPITFANWTIPLTGNSPQAIYNATQIWTFTGPTNAPGTIYGYYLTRDSDNQLMLAERFSAALVPFVPEAGSQARVLLRYSVASQF